LSSSSSLLLDEVDELEELDESSSSSSLEELDELDEELDEEVTTHGFGLFLRSSINIH